jgi:uncharacterized protein YuzE
MKVTYDTEADAISIILRDHTIEESDESRPGVILDYDKNGEIVSIEILEATKHTENPRSVEYAVSE